MKVSHVFNNYFLKLVIWCISLSTDSHYWLLLGHNLRKKRMVLAFICFIYSMFVLNIIL